MSAAGEAPAGALDGILVADFSRVLAGPYATMLLADLGAEVVKVERPGVGDDTRTWGPPHGPDGRATYFTGVNRNKTSLALDLRDPADAARARELAARADVVVENFRPGTMDRLGLGYTELREANPGVVYASLSGFGEGAGAALGGYDLVVQAVGGLMSITGESPGREVKVGVAVVDVLTGLHLAIGVLAALRHRERTGRGQRVATDLLSCSLSSLVNQAAAYLGAGVVAAPMGNRHPSIAPYEVYPTAAGRLAVAVGNDGLFHRFARVLGAPELTADPRFATNPDRVRHREALHELVAAALARRGAADWAAELAAAGVPAGPVNDIAGAFGYAAELGLDPVVELAGTRTVRNPLRLSETPAAYRLPPPELGG